MKLITAYLRIERGEQLMRALHDVGVSGLSAYVVHGISGETSTFLYSKRPFEAESSARIAQTRSDL